MTPTAIGNIKHRTTPIQINRHIHPKDLFTSVPITQCMFDFQKKKLQAAKMQEKHNLKRQNKH